MKAPGPFKSVFSILSDKHSHIDRLAEKNHRILLYQLVVISLLSFIIGVVMGSNHSIAQAISSGLKMIVLLLSVMIICFPSFYIIQRVMGSKLTFGQMMTIVMSGFILTQVIVVSFAPIVIFFMAIGSKYHFIQLLHVAIFLFGGFWGLRFMIDSLQYACEEKKIYPRTGVTVFKVWVVILAFVSIQLSWNLRPFLGQRGEDFKLFRHYKGNFYTAVVYSIRQLGSGEEETKDDMGSVDHAEKAESDDHNTGVRTDSIQPIEEAIDE